MGASRTPLQYTGQYTDDEAGFLYLRARYYDPSTAQFLTVDPMVNSTRTPYAYVGGEPLDTTDPKGKSQEIRERIINGRIRHLETEIRGFQEQLNKLTGGCK